MALFATDLAQQFQSVTVGFDQRMAIGPRVEAIAPTLGDDPIAYKIAIDPDDKVIVIFLPAHNQGSVTVQ